VRNLVYQIFVDRFAGPGGEPLPSAPDGVDPWKHHCGGTLDGIAARLDHIASLGADALYLTPIFRAPSNHKYDTESFDEVDARFGGDGAFEQLAKACGERGMGLVLDGVFNHVGEWHPWFSARKEWFLPTHWRGYGWLPELDLARAEVRDEVESILRKWLRRGATGWRLDCANDLGRSVCSHAVRVAAEERAADGVIGEIMTYAQEWCSDGVLDGVMNYYFRESVIGLVRGEVPASQAAYNFKRMARHYRSQALLRSWNVLATHDTPRLSHLAPDAGARSLARALAFASPGTPLIYYGEEIGMHGAGDPDNRRPMIWDEHKWDQPTLAHVRLLAQVRRDRPALREGAYLPLPHPGVPRLLAFARTTERPKDAVLVLANASPEPLEARVFAPYSFLFDALPLVDLLGVEPTVRVQAGSFPVTLRPWGVALYAPDDSTIPGYSFFRDR
jgi:glycosidase